MSKAVYNDYFGFSKDPFSIAPDPSLLYPSQQHKQALGHLKYGLGRNGGFILLTGEVGTGKTTLTRLFLQQLSSEIRIAYILNTKLGSEALLYSICQELEIELPESARTDLSQSVEYLNKDLLAAHGQNKKTLLVIEESQNLAADVLETLRLLTNLETNTSKLLHILLVAQPELLETLARQNLRQLNQRVISRYHLLPLRLADISHYIDFRIDKAGGQSNLFSKQAIKRLYNHSKGIPRVLNLLAERSLMSAYSQELKYVTPKIVDDAGIEVFGKAHRPIRKVGLMKVAAFAVALGGISLIASFVTTLQTKQLQAYDELVNPDSVSPQRQAESHTVVDLLSQSLSTENQPHLSAVKQLINLWLPSNSQINTIDNLCDPILLDGLSCETLQNPSLEVLRRINLPGLVTVNNSDDVLQRYLVRSISKDSIIVSNARLTQSIPIAKFSQQWQGDYLMLWQAPAGYTKALYPGSSNSVLVRWLLTELQKTQPEVAHLITGGNYSIALAEYVKRFQQEQGLKPDGILGVQTILALNQLRNGQPTLQTMAEY